MKKGYIIIIILLSIGTIIFIFFILTGSLFKVKNVVLNYNFKTNEKKMKQYLGILPEKSIFKYNMKEMNNKLSKLYYLDEYKAYKKYPNTIVVNMKAKLPVAQIVGIDGKIFVIDKKGVVFRESTKKDNKYPLLIISELKNIKSGIVLKGKYKDILNELDYIKKKMNNLYNSISQIEIAQNEKYGIDYTIMYKTLNTRIYLKNQINVDAIRRGLACSLYIEDKKEDNKNILYTYNGFIY